MTAPASSSPRAQPEKRLLAGSATDLERRSCERIVSVAQNTTEISSKIRDFTDGLSKKRFTTRALAKKNANFFERASKVLLACE
jgi:hypothetical protein